MSAPSRASVVARRSPAAAQCRGEAATVGGRRGALDYGDLVRWENHRTRWGFFQKAMFEGCLRE